MFRWLRKSWHAHLRWIDLQILWPACKRWTSSLDQAKDAFASHACRDEAWLELGEERIKASIDALK